MERIEICQKFEKFRICGDTLLALNLCKKSKIGRETTKRRKNRVFFQKVSSMLKVLDNQQCQVINAEPSVFRHGTISEFGESTLYKLLDLQQC